MPLPPGFLCNGNDVAQAVAIQSDGKIIVVGYADTTTSSSDFALARLNTDGTLDPSFGSGGKVITATSASADTASAVSIQPDGKIVVAGQTIGTYERDFALVRYNTNGTPDSSFGTAGIVITPFSSGSNDIANAVAIQADGKIVAAGSTSGGFISGAIALARYNADGTLDNNFGTGGKVTTYIDSNNVAYSVALQPDGKIVAAGSANGGPISSTGAVVRYNSDGSLDNNFGTGGKVATPVNSNFFFNAIIIQPDGKIVGSGTSAFTSTMFILVRYNADGTLDSSFGAGGKVNTPVSSGGNAASGIGLQPDGKIVVVGYAANSGSNNADFATVRYLGISFALLTEANSNQAIALDAVTMQRTPFSLFNPNYFTADHRTRISLFASTLGLPPGNNSTVITAQAEDVQHRIYPLIVEYAGQVPNFYWLNQVIIKLPDEFQAAGDVSISINYQGVTSNKVIVRIQ